jgi:hypothetical protein
VGLRSWGKLVPRLFGKLFLAVYRPKRLAPPKLFPKSLGATQFAGRCTLVADCACQLSAKPVKISPASDIGWIGKGNALI